MRFIVVSTPADSKLHTGDMLTRAQCERVCEIPVNLIPDHRKRVALVSEFISNNGYKFLVTPEENELVWPDTPQAKESEGED